MSADFQADMKLLEMFERDLLRFGQSKAVGIANKEALNNTAREAAKIWKREIPQRMITRNQWTERGVLYAQTASTNPRTAESVVYHRDRHMERTEYGGTEKGKRGRLSIPTGYATGETGKRSGPLKKLVRKPHRMQNIKLGRRKRGKSKTHTNIMAIHDALTGSRSYVFLEGARYRGIFRIVGGKRRPKVRMVQDLSKRSVITKPHPSLEPALRTLDRTGKRSEFYQEALIRQLRFHKLW